MDVSLYKCNMVLFKKIEKYILWTIELNVVCLLLFLVNYYLISNNKLYYGSFFWIIGGNLGHNIYFSIRGLIKYKRLLLMSFHIIFLMINVILISLYYSYLNQYFFNPFTYFSTTL